MGLTTAQQTIYQKMRTSSASAQAVPLTDDHLRLVINIAVRDLGLVVEGTSGDVPELFDPAAITALTVPGPNPLTLFSRACDASVDVDTYVSCLAAILKARLKYERVLATQPIPTLDQVGPRGLLQYGLLGVPSLAALLVWRKWVFDIDNRAAQDTGYFVEPILAGAIGGAPYGAKTSPIKRKNDPSKGRQVDCVKGALAYEFKIRMTIAASGQGRWQEELDFAGDCQASGYEPVLLVLDPTSSTKLTQLRAAFTDAGGTCFVGDDAWAHLEAESAPAMRLFIEKYLRVPLEELFTALPIGARLPDFSLRQNDGVIEFLVGADGWTVARLDGVPVEADEAPDIEGLGETLPGIG